MTLVRNVIKEKKCQRVFHCTLCSRCCAVFDVFMVINGCISNILNKCSVKRHTVEKSLTYPN